MTAPERAHRAHAPIIVESLDQLDLRASGRPAYVTVGTFDGVHRGHQALIGDVVRHAREDGATAAVFTFQNHPRSVLTPDRSPLILTPWPLKARLLSALGLDVLVGLPFTPAFASTPAEDFLRDVLLGRAAATLIASGGDFRFGHRGAGTAVMLAEATRRLGFRYLGEYPQQDDGVVISSSKVRDAITGGEVARAARFLGRPHRLDGLVVTGDRIGRTLGFPTANMAFAPGLALPGDGVYAVRAAVIEAPGAALGADAIPGMMNFGVRPTVGGREYRAEVHLIGFDGELPGRTLGIEFIARLRGEKRFASLDDLKAQLARDRETALVALAHP